MNFSKAQFGYAPLLLGATALLFFKNIIYARLLPVAGFGSLNQAVFLGGALVTIAGAGLPLLGQKMLPQYYARDDKESATALLASAVAAFLAVALVVAVLISIAWSFGFLKSPAWWFALLVYAGAQYAFALKLITIKSKLRFASYARVSIGRAVLLVVFGVLTALILRSAAAVLIVEGCVTIAALFSIGDHARQLFRRVNWRLSPSEWSWLRVNLRSALNLLWLNGIFIVLYGLDRWAGLSLLDDHAFGIYSIGLTVITVFESAQSIVNVAVYPLMARMFSDGLVDGAFRLASTATLIVVGATVVLYFPFNRLLDMLLHEYLPAYAAASTVLKISVIAGALRLADFFCTFAILCDRENRLTKIFAAEIIGIVVLLSLLKGAFGMQFDPDRMAYIALAVAALTVTTNFAVARHAHRQIRRIYYA